MRQLVIGLTLLCSCLSTVFAQDILRAEYFIDTDPGVGQGTEIPSFTASQAIDIDFNVNTTGLSIGKHNLFVRVLDTDNKWSIEHGKS